MRNKFAFLRVPNLEPHRATEYLNEIVLIDRADDERAPRTANSVSFFCAVDPDHAHQHAVTLE